MDNVTTDDIEEDSLSINGEWWVFAEPGRTIAEDPILKAHSENPISFNYLGDRVCEEQIWFFTFNLKDTDGNDELKKAVLDSIYTVDDDAGLQTLRVNGGVMVPDGLLDAIRDRDEVGEIGRPPRIPGRDSEE